MANRSTKRNPAEGAPGPTAPAYRPIRSWASGDRPRERLRDLGPSALTVRELLAILVGSGGKQGSALDVAHGLLKGLEGPMTGGREPADSDGGQGGPQAVEGSLRRLASLPAGVLEEHPGIGAATSSRIMAALELGRRAASDTGKIGEPVRGPGDVFERMGPLLRDLSQEEFHALLLNTQHRITRSVLVTRGILDAALIHPREVFRPAIVEGAAGVILVHNHPSGNPAPSREDKLITGQMVSAGQAVGIPVLDHVIVGGEGYVSLAEAGGLSPAVERLGG